MHTDLGSKSGLGLVQVSVYIDAASSARRECAAARLLNILRPKDPEPRPTPELSQRRSLASARRTRSDQPENRLTEAEPVDDVFFGDAVIPHQLVQNLSVIYVPNDFGSASIPVPVYS